MRDKLKKLLKTRSKESRLESIRQERQAVGGEGSSAAHDKHYEFEDILAIDSDATRDSSGSNTDEEKDDETDDSKDLAIDLSDDEPNKKDDATGFGVFVYKKSTKLLNSTSFNPTVTYSSLDYIQNLLNEPCVHELMDLSAKKFILMHTQPLRWLTQREILSQISLFTTSSLTTEDLSKMDLKLKLLNRMYQNKSFENHNTHQKLYNTLYESITLDQQALHVQDTEQSFNKRSHDDQDPPNDREGETIKKEERIRKRPNAVWFNTKLGSVVAAKRKMTWFDKLLKSNIDQNEDHILGPSTVAMAKKLKELFKKDELTIADLEGAGLEKLKKQYKNDVGLEYHVDQLKDDVRKDFFKDEMGNRRSDKTEYEFSYADLPSLSLNDVEDMYLLKLNEVNKFCDGTLLKIRDNLLEMVNKNELVRGNKSLKGRDWSNKDIKRSNEMLEKIH
ncbi:hypothetical protein Tco_0085615 [Tanacetum coccineum]